MSEWFPLLAVLCIGALVVRCLRPSRSVRADLRAAIEQQRPAMLVDAASAPVPAVASALTLAESQRPPAPCASEQRVPWPALPWRRARAAAHHEVACMIWPLGLQLVTVIRTHEPRFGPARVLGGHTEMVGQRHGRHVAIRLEEGSSSIELGCSCEPFAVAGTGDGWAGERDGAPTAVAALLDAITPHERWVGIEITAGSEGLVLRRAAAPTRSWMHDLWLAERFADAAAHCPAGVPARAA